ncbi:hypothetical protein VIBNISFn27_330013 [Vibrio nigripulchritudo SFn27]|nr:hypothetical protein VIBNIAM115_1980099 [Vibrio nigripulchritudo AM115]CCN88446.1 hypothetical protein VIBNISFn27_330013 [Vibrio nigripulchritudo SFn27]
MLSALIQQTVKSQPLDPVPIFNNFRIFSMVKPRYLEQITLKGSLVSWFLKQYNTPLTTRVVYII